MHSQIPTACMRQQAVATCAATHIAVYLVPWCTQASRLQAQKRKQQQQQQMLQAQQLQQTAEQEAWGGGLQQQQGPFQV